MYPFQDVGLSHRCGKGKMYTDVHSVFVGIFYTPSQMDVFNIQPLLED